LGAAPAHRVFSAPPRRRSGVDARLLFLLGGNGVALIALRLLVVLDPAAHARRGLGGVLAVELHLLVQRLALGLQWAMRCSAASITAWVWARAFLRSRSCVAASG
jgi:hypothetical protein